MMKDIKLHGYVATWNGYSIGFKAENEKDAKKMASKLFQVHNNVKVKYFNN